MEHTAAETASVIDATKPPATITIDALGVTLRFGSVGDPGCAGVYSAVGSDAGIDAYHWPSHDEPWFVSLRACRRPGFTVSFQIAASSLAEAIDRAHAELTEPEWDSLRSLGGAA